VSKKAVWTYRSADDALVRRLEESLGVSPVLALILSRLCVDEVEAERHLRPQLAHVSDPFAVGGLREAAERLVRAVDRKERIALLGDYDVDGVTSTAALVHVLRKLGAEPAFYVPRRMEEGYGLSNASIDRVLAEAKPDLFVALDCGTNSHAEVQRLRDAGVDVLIIDHHVAKDGPATGCLLVNPRVLDATDAPWQSLCTAGLTFKLIHAILKVLRLSGDSRGTTIVVKDYLDLAALGTIADLVPLRAENRILASHGLKALSDARRPGVRALIAVSGLEPGQTLSSTDISYRIGPRINASGRLADAAIPLKLLLADSHEDCQDGAAQLDALNRERQEIDRKVTEEATSQLEGMLAAPGLVAQGDWHPGVVGIAAGKLCRTFTRPVIVLGREGDIAKGSGRSVTGVNLVEVLQTCHDLLGNYGGHPMAVGVSMPLANVPEFRRRFAEGVAATLATQPVAGDITTEVSAWLTPEDISFQVLDELELLQPFGEGNPEPLFGLKGVVFDRPVQKFGEGDVNFRHTLLLSGGRRLGLLAWRMGSRVPEPGKPIDLAVRLSWNRWQGRKNAQAEVIDWRFSASR
jgi:single-stranded-DNA-specific exonuclease